MSKKWLFLGIAVIISFIATSVLIYRWSKTADRNRTESQSLTSIRVGTIGSETIYQSTLDAYKSRYQEQESELWERLKNDSARLQYGSTIGVVNLDSTFYNSSQIDIQKRLDQVNKVASSQQNKKKYSYLVLSVYFNSAKQLTESQITTSQQKAAELLEKISSAYYDFQKRSEIALYHKAAVELDSYNATSPVEVKYLDQILPDIQFSNVYTPHVLTLEPNKWSSGFVVTDSNIPVAMAKTYLINTSELAAAEVGVNNFSEYLQKINVQRSDTQ